MRIAFMGKGGSGKTTLTTAFAKFLLKQKKDTPVFLFDVDLNSHIANELEIDFPIENFFGGKFKEVSDFIEPQLLERLSLKEIPEFGTILPNQDTKFIKLDDVENKFVNRYGVKKDNLTLFAAGNHLTKDHAGHSCYHDMLNTYELIMHRIADNKNNYVIADTTAGIDNVGTSLYMAYDLVVFIVEPTDRSIAVYKDYINVAEVDKSKVFVVGNKIENEADEKFIKKIIEEDRILALFKANKEIYRDADQTSYDHFIEEHKDQLQTILNKLDSTDKDWDSYFQELFRLFKKETTGWWSDFYGVDLEDKFKEDYSFINNNFNN
ncbi:MAG: hypothetical protein ACOCXT_00235 [Candidatus Dojkabacteria bacterium]